MATRNVRNHGVAVLRDVVIPGRTPSGAPSDGEPVSLSAQAFPAARPVQPYYGYTRRFYAARSAQGGSERVTPGTTDRDRTGPGAHPGPR